MIYEDVISRLNDDQLLWLKEVYKRNKGLNKLNIRNLIRDLHGELSSEFSIDDLSPIYFINDERSSRRYELTLFGVYIAAPKSKIITDIERIVNTIKKRLLVDPTDTKFEASYFEEELSLDYEYVTKLLRYYSDLKGFWSSTTGIPKKIGLSSINTKGEYPLLNLLRFNNLEDKILESLEDSFQKSKERSFKYITYDSRKGFDRDTGVESDEHYIYSDTAFIIMQMNQDTIDTKNAIKDVCNEFGIKAVRADDIEHSDVITKKILEHIRRSELLIADLTGARPNVYYEIGYAHALNKKPILYRKKGTDLHFDLKVHNVPEYDNNTKLKKLLRKRLEAVLGRKPEKFSSRRNF